MNDNTPLVSVIIPVYKVEQYLDECVNSVRNQTYQNLQIILVDDGSPDNCGAMCDEYAVADPRIKVIHKQNGGVAQARNIGLQNATGEYLFFVDSDDTVMPDAVSLLIAKAQEFEVDMVCAACNQIDENGQHILSEARTECRLMETDEALRYYAPKEWAPWNRLIKSSVHKGILFPPYKIHEDEAIKFRLLERCKSVLQIGDALYCYRQRGGSITSKESKTDRMDMFYSRRENYEYLKKKHPDVVDYFLPNVCDAALYNLGCLLRQSLSNERKLQIDEIVSFARENYETIRRSAYLTASQKVRFTVMIHSKWHKEKCLYMWLYGMLERIRENKK